MKAVTGEVKRHPGLVPVTGARAKEGIGPAHQIPLHAAQLIVRRLFGLVDKVETLQVGGNQATNLGVQKLL